MNYQTSFLIFLVVLFFSCTTENRHNKINPTILAKQASYLELKKLIIEDRGPTDSIQVKILSLENDSLKNHLMFDISYHYYKSKDSAKFRFWNDQTFKLSEKLNDSSKIAESNWDLGSFFYQQNVSDSSYLYYNKAFNLYERIGDTARSGRMLLNMASIQNEINDFVGSEVTAISAIKKLKPLHLDLHLYRGYNLLGILNNELKEYDKALSFHQKALSYEEKLNTSVFKATSFNNIGVIYRNKRNYKKSLEYFGKAISIDSIHLKNPRLFAMLLDNSAYSKFKLNDTIGLENEFLYALKIRDSIDHKAGMIINHLHLGEYYLIQADSSKALVQIQMAKSLSEEYHSYGDLLESLLFLAKINPVKSNQYFSKYVGLSDSLQNEERAIRNKFARIRFETDEFISKNEVLAVKNSWLTTGATIILILFLLFYIIKIKKDKNYQLSLKQKQQLANEEIYNLLIDSQNKLDEGKEKEKKRISKELHDGILSKFFGVRLNLELLNNGITNESIAQREIYINELRQLENEIRTVSHRLKVDMVSTENSFKTIVEELLNDQKKIGLFKCKLDLDENIVWDHISSKIKINVYRIIQEALHNIIKYSGANLVEIIFIKENNNLKVEVKDDGVGFNTNANSNGIGLLNMRLRVKDLSGEIQIKSSNSGTEIIMYVPYHK